MRQRLKKLDSQAVERELDELLTPREIKALLKRRDRVLQLAGAVTKKR
jgi:hypothetical protein